VCIRGLDAWHNAIAIETRREEVASELSARKKLAQRSAHASQKLFIHKILFYTCKYVVYISLWRYFFAVGLFAAGNRTPTWLIGMRKMLPQCVSVSLRL